MSDHSALVDFYKAYGEQSFARDEPAYAQICAELVNHPDVVALIAAHERDAQQPNLLFAAVHYLLLGGLDHPLAGVYSGTSAASPTAVFADLVLSHRAEINELLATKRTQTNEVGRCSVLSLLLSEVGAEAAQPIAWIDLGASGGLNLHLDRYRMCYSIGEQVASTGPVDAALTLECEVRTGSPTIRPAVDISWRLGVDHAPIDVGDVDQARWLRACLWPSNTERLSRLDAAIQVANEHPVEIVKADAVSGLHTAINRAPASSPLVVTTSWVWYYLPPKTQVAALEVLRNAGRDVYWFSIEAAGVVEELQEKDDRHSIESTIGMVAFGASGNETRAVLGHCHAHGAYINWASTNA